MTLDFQRCGILINVDLDEVEPPFNPLKPNVIFVGCGQTVYTQIRHQRVRRLIRAFTVFLQNVLFKFE